MKQFTIQEERDAQRVIAIHTRMTNAALERKSFQTHAALKQELAAINHFCESYLLDAGCYRGYTEGVCGEGAPDARIYCQPFVIECEGLHVNPDVYQVMKD
ncbi:hypothetical protein Arno162_18 [Pectobacterium phage Arno162]|uniref:Uncharacterized protein n=1 Tax=Pectobacterium phage Arno162 TaxID=2500577 RepID=A0A678ZJH9_9CAUD|nr:hypothetical protein Arno162_18 [Pectobacterium phage Arno162]